MFLFIGRSNYLILGKDILGICADSLRNNIALENYGPLEVTI